MDYFRALTGLFLLLFSAHLWAAWEQVCVFKGVNGGWYDSDASACATYEGMLVGGVSVLSGVTNGPYGGSCVGTVTNPNTGQSAFWSGNVQSSCIMVGDNPQPAGCPASGTTGSFTLNWAANTGLRCLGGCSFMGNAAGRGTDSEGNPQTTILGSYTGASCEEPDDEAGIDAPIDQGDGDGGTGEGEGGEDGPPPNPGACYDMHGWPTPCVPVEGGDTGGGDGDGGGDDSGGGTGEVGTGGDGEDTGGTGPGGSGDGGGSGDNGDGGGTGGTGDGGGGGTGGNGNGDSGGGGSGGGSTGDPDGKPNGSSFGGSCMGGFSCTGDALQCAIAREQHRRNCEIDKALTDDYGAVNDYSSAVSDSKGNGSGKLTDRLSDNSAGGDISGMLDTSSATGSGSCVKDTTFSFKGDSFAIPWSDHCNLFLWLGNILVLISLLIAAFIIKGGVK